LTSAAEVAAAPDPASIVTERGAAPADIAARPVAQPKRNARLPSEIERRAAAVGLGSGHISRSLALEVEGALVTSPAAARPRRVTEAAPSSVPADTPATRKRRVTAPRSTAPAKKPRQ
jgi:hypothetical protein